MRLLQKSMTQDKPISMNGKGKGPTTNGQPPTANRLRRSERGYILLMLMLFVALLAIAAGAVAPSIAFRVRRDREEEMIHRGVQYSRAIRRYVKKTGRYPSRIEELENTNNVRFLRQRYKDPITGKDFKVLHIGDVQLTGATGIPGATPVGGSPATGPSPGAGAAALLGGALTQATATSTAPALESGAAATGAAGNPGQDAASESADSAESSKTEKDQPGGGISSGQLSSTVFGGGPIVGVASISKAKSIREFNHKSRYNQWQFIYDPTMDRGGLITTPAQPALSVAAPLQQQNSSGAQGPSGGLQSPPPAQSTPQQ